MFEMFLYGLLCENSVYVNCTRRVVRILLRTEFLTTNKQPKGGFIPFFVTRWESQVWVLIIMMEMAGGSANALISICYM